MLALQRAGVFVEKYFASEIDKYAIQVSEKNFPEIKRLWDVTKISYRDWWLFWEPNGIPLKDDMWETEIDLLIGGSPCQSLSIAWDRTGFDGKSWLFYEYVRLLKEVRPKYFLLENVASMSKENKQIITDVITEIYSDTQVHMINSALVSAQNRKRLYRTNIPGITQPEDKRILIKDILEDDVEEKYYLSDKLLEWFRKHNINHKEKKTWFIFKQRDLDQKDVTLRANAALCPTDNTIRIWQFNSWWQWDRVYSDEWKSVSLSANGGWRWAKTGLYACAMRGRNIVDGMRKDILWAKTEQRIEVWWEEKCHTITSVQKDSMIIQKVGDRNKESRWVHEDKSYSLPANPMSDRWQMVLTDRIRKLTPIECERLQNLPDDRTASVSNSQRYKMIGNGRTVDVIAHILSFIK